MNSTWVSVKIRPEKNSGLYRIWTDDLCDIDTMLYQLSQVNMLEPTYWPASSWLVSSVGRALHQYGEVMDSNSVQTWIFSGLIFTTAQVVFITAKIPFIFT